MAGEPVRPDTLGGRIKSARLWRGIRSASELAREVRGAPTEEEPGGRTWSRQHISAIEADAWEPGRDLLEAIARRLDLPVDWFLDGFQRHGEEEEFVALMSGSATRLTAAQRRQVIALVNQMVAENDAEAERRKAEPAYDEERFNLYVQAFREAGASEELLSQVVPAAKRRLRDQDVGRPTPAQPPGPDRRQGRREG